jgi:60 kDa SS-A/Ro ribonucleoprotein
MPRYARHLTRPPQREPIFGRDQIKNDAGGHVFEIDSFEAFDRFLILGCETGTYYAGESKMTQRAAAIVLECARRDPLATVNAIKASSGRAIKPDPAIFALALLAGQVNSAELSLRAAARLALLVVNDVCRISTHLFSFVDQVTQFRGWGSALKRAVAGWYTEKKPQDLLYQVTKYQQRGGWSHRDLLRLSHPVSQELDPVFKYIVSGDPFDDKVQTLDGDLIGYIGAIETVKRASDERLVLRMIRDHNLVREHIPTSWLNSPRVWEALLERMPYTALLRNLGKMSNVGLLTPLSESTKLVCEKLRTSQIRYARIHPFALLLAQTTYAAGHGFRGRLSWTPDQHIVDALEDAFYNAFESVEPAGKNFLLGIDVSGSMGWRGFEYMGSIAGTHIKAYQAAAVMAMVQTKTEPWCHSVAFSGRGKLTEVALSRKRRLDDVLEELQRIPVGPTDCALPMIYAAENNLPIDTFVVYTDDETWCGDIHPVRALEDYRQKMGRDAKLVACGMTATNYSVADLNDPGMLDVVGFDASCPAVISKFAKG